MATPRSRQSAIRQAARDVIPALLEEAGGRLATRQIYRSVQERHPDLCDDGIICPYEKGTWHHPEWEHLVAHALQALRKAGVIRNVQIGTWELVGHYHPPSPEVAAPPAEQDAGAATSREESIREHLLNKLSSMSDKEFENFVGRVLEQLGYDNIDVVGRSGDGGVDVTCILKGPLLRPPVYVVCQVKRHATNIGPSPVGDLRGRWAHRADRLILVNTGGFTHGAQEAATEAGAKEVSLVSGEELANLLIEKGIGVIRQPVVLEKVDEAFFSQSS